jgi:hypothetical protein
MQQGFGKVTKGRTNKGQEESFLDDARCEAITVFSIALD